MDNLGRDMQRMMWMLLGAGILFGGIGGAVILWLIQKFSRG